LKFISNFILITAWENLIRIWVFKSHKYALYFSALSECVQTGNNTITRLTLQRLNLLLNELNGVSVLTVFFDSI